MSNIKNYLDKIRPQFEDGGKLKPLRSVFEGFESFLLVPSVTSKSGVSIHDAIDSKRIMSFVVIALIPALLFGMYNIGFQNYKAAGVDASWFTMFAYGFLVMLPKIIVSYIVGLGIEFAVAQWKHEEIQEGRGRGCPEAQQHLQAAVDKAGEQAPLHAVAEGDQHKGQHAQQGNAAAVGQGEELDVAQHGANGDHQGALHKNAGLGIGF